MKLEDILSKLGQPNHRGENWAIYTGDCLKFLAMLPEGSLPLTVTSPPYNIGKAYELVRDTNEYIDWCTEWISLVHRATMSDGAFWLNLGYLSLPGRAKALPIPYLLWDRVPFFLIQEVIWNYGAGVAARRSFSPRNEKFLWYVKNPKDYTFNLDDIRDPDVKYPNQRKRGKLKCNPLGKNPTDVWQIPKVTSGRDRASKERTLHPSQFPTAVVDRIVRACSKPGEVILDPFMGSGSLAEAAVRAGRQAIGFEINPNYVNLATQRLQTAMAQLALL